MRLFLQAYGGGAYCCANQSRCIPTPAATTVTLLAAGNLLGPLYPSSIHPTFRSSSPHVEGQTAAQMHRLSSPDRIVDSHEVISSKTPAQETLSPAVDGHVRNINTLLWSWVLAQPFVWQTGPANARHLC